MAVSGVEDQEFFKKGVAYHDKGEYTKAIEFYKKTLDTYGIDKKTLVLLGNAYYMSKEYEKAEGSYKNALSLDPTYSKAYFNLGIVYEATKRHDESIGAYKKAIELDNKFAQAYANLGDVYKELKEIDNAIINYSKALEIDNNIENAAEALKFIPDHLIEKARNRDRVNRADESLRRGIGFERKGEMENAQKSYQEAIKIYPKTASAHLLHALSKTGQEKPIVAKDELKFLDMDPRLISDSISPEVRDFLANKLGDIEFSQKSLEHFFKRFKELVGQEEKSKIDIMILGRTILFDEAEQTLKKALDFELKKKTEEAKKTYQDAIDKAPYLLHAYYMYGFFLELSEQEDEAFKAYTQATHCNLEYLDERLKEDVVTIFSKRPGYEYLENIDTVSILAEFYESTLKEETVSLLRFIRYKLSLEAEAKLKYGFEKEESGEHQEALSAYEDAINIDPGNPVSHYVLGLAYENRGLENEAMDIYNKTKLADFLYFENLLHFYLFIFVLYKSLSSAHVLSFFFFSC